jgi:hypothetical protein
LHEKEGTKKAPTWYFSVRFYFPCLFASYLKDLTVAAWAPGPELPFQKLNLNSAATKVPHWHPASSYVWRKKQRSISGSAVQTAAPSHKTHHHASVSVVSGQPSARQTKAPEVADSPRVPSGLSSRRPIPVSEGDTTGHAAHESAMGSRRIVAGRRASLGSKAHQEAAPSTTRTRQGGIGRDTTSVQREAHSTLISTQHGLKKTTARGGKFRAVRHGLGWGK